MLILDKLLFSVYADTALKLYAFLFNLIILIFFNGSACLFLKSIDELSLLLLSYIPTELLPLMRTSEFRTPKGIELWAVCMDCIFSRRFTF